jgi:hypothetical protein
MDFGLPILILVDRQFYPLTSEIQQFQTVVEDGVLRELWLRSATTDGQVGQDKLFKLF